MNPEALAAQLLTARAQLFLANFEQATELLASAAATDAPRTRREVGRMLMPEQLPPSSVQPEIAPPSVSRRRRRATGHH